MGGFLTQAVLIDVVTWFGITVVLGGAGAFATGRALARGWQPAFKLIPYMLILAAAAAFLCWALFGLRILSPTRIGAALLAADWPELGFAVAGYLLSLAVLLAIGRFGFSFTRRGQMRRQYPFLAEGARA